ncbi:MAG: hypothetical protein R6U57_08405 [Anaerolineales bacterium]
MKGPRFQVLALLVLFSLVLVACGMSTPDPVEEEMKVKVRVAATLTQEALEEESATEEVVVVIQPTMTPIPPSQTPEPTISPTPKIEHTMVPQDPGNMKIRSHLTDVSSIHYAAEGFTYGDQYPINRFERPFTAETMEYVGYLDIVLTNLKTSSPWVYFILHLEEDLPESADVTYGVELDLDEDGRGDYFIAAGLPGSEKWTTRRVRVYKDVDDDVGGPNPLFSDAPAEGLNGYEVIIFDEGQGLDPDLAWVRRDPEAANQLQIAIKDSLVSMEGYLWSVWADGGPQDLTLADYNDRWTFEEAGSPYPEHALYPIKALALVDSTCRSWVGFEPVGTEPGLCQGTGEGTGWQICYDYVVNDILTATNCFGECLEECPDLPPDSDRLHYYCKKCTMD